MIDGCRLSGWWQPDPISTTWTAWVPMTGERLLLRCLHKRWCRDPVMQRRLQRDLQVEATAGLVVGQYCSEGDWVHNRVSIHGARMSEVLPHGPNEVGDSLLMTQVMVGGLNALTSLHQAQMSGSTCFPRYCFCRRHRKHRLAGRYLVPPFLRMKTSPCCLKPLCYLPESSLVPRSANRRRLVRELRRRTPKTRARCYRGPWQQHRSTLATVCGLTIEISPSEPHQPTGHRPDELAAGNDAPPMGRVCLRADNNGELVIAEADEQGLRGQRTTNAMESNLKTVYTHESRVLIRSLPGSFCGIRLYDIEEMKPIEQRYKVNRRFRYNSRRDDALVGWMAWLRAARLILRAEERVPSSRIDTWTLSHHPHSK